MFGVSSVFTLQVGNIDLCSDFIYAGLSFQRIENILYAAAFPPFLHGKSWHLYYIDVNLVKGAHERNKLCCLICLRYLIRSRAASNPTEKIDLVSYMRVKHFFSDHN